MQNNSNHAFCSHCVYPSDMQIAHPQTGDPLRFNTVNGRLICELCAHVLYVGLGTIRKTCNQELAAYYASRKRMLFAYSGGLDSTVALAHLLNACRNHGIVLETFTVTTGVKGREAVRNIEAVIRHFGLTDSHMYVDVTHTVQNDPAVVAVTGTPLTTFEVYRHCAVTGTLPCGKVCNRMIDCAYQKIMKVRDFPELVTGGDTPKRTPKNTYSIFWRKPSGITIVRGGFTNGMNKTNNRAFVRSSGIPWNDPECGGYDTDCLMPGAYFWNATCGQGRMSLEDVIERFPIVLDYLSERVRFGIIEREEALRRITDLDISSEEAKNEHDTLFGIHADQQQRRPS